MVLFFTARFNLLVSALNAATTGELLWQVRHRHAAGVTDVVLRRPRAGGDPEQQHGELLQQLSSTGALMMWLIDGRVHGRRVGADRPAGLAYFGSDDGSMYAAVLFSVLLLLLLLCVSVCLCLCLCLCFHLSCVIIIIIFIMQCSSTTYLVLSARVRSAHGLEQQFVYYIE